MRTSGPGRAKLGTVELVGVSAKLVQTEQRFALAPGSRGLDPVRTECERRLPPLSLSLSQQRIANQIYLSVGWSVGAVFGLPFGLP